MSDLINATKGQALNTGALVQSSQNLVASNGSLVTQTTNLVTQATNQVTATNNLTTAVTNLTTAINNAIALGPWNTWSPTVASQAGTITTLGTLVARYAQAGKNVYFSLTIPITTNGTGSAWINASLPVTPKAATTVVGREVASTGKSLTGTINSGSSTMVIQTYDNSYPGGSGFTLVVSGVYEAQ